MGSSLIVSSEKGLRKGAWAEEEDLLLRICIIKYGEGKWRQVPLRAGMVPNNDNITATAEFPNDSQVVNKNITKCDLPLLVDNHHDQCSPANDLQRIRDDSTHWLKNFLFGESEEEDLKKKKKKPMKKKPKKKKGITSGNIASIELEPTPTFDVEEGIFKTGNDGGSHAYYCSFDGDQKSEEGGNVGDTDHYWNSYLDNNLWRMLGEEQDQYLMKDDVR
ncbi:hypothetical protein MKX01_033124 [Papaver californicum]|nr:hypothetical protein MKX01_033124 [Papaver californicum]